MVWSVIQTLQRVMKAAAGVVMSAATSVEQQNVKLSLSVHFPYSLSRLIILSLHPPVLAAENSLYI